MSGAGAAPFRLMAVHAHPDDECTSTGGILAHYALRGCEPAGKLPASQFHYAFGTEAYIRTRDTTGASTPENDLFTGLGNPQLQLR
jgi:hypothetical protein